MRAVAVAVFILVAFVAGAIATEESEPAATAEPESEAVAPAGMVLIPEGTVKSSRLKLRRRTRFDVDVTTGLVSETSVDGFFLDAQEVKEAR